MSRLEWMNEKLGSSIAGALRYSRLIILLTLAWVVLCAYLTHHIGRIVSIEEQLDPKLESTLDLKRSQALFGEQHALGFIVPNANYHDLCVLKTLIPTLAQKYPQIKKSSDVLRIRQASVVGQELHYPTVLNDPCLADGATPFDAKVFDSSPWANVLVSQKTSDFLSIVSVPFAVHETGNLMTDIQSAFTKEVIWTGIVAHDFYTNQGMDQALWQNIMIFFIVLISFRVAFGTWRSCFIYFGTLAVSALSVYGGMAISGEKMDPLSACLFLMLTVAALEDFVFLSYSQMESTQKSGKKTAFQSLALPCLFTSLTTFIAFGSLTLSPLVSIRHFGLWASFGSAMEWLAVFYILPSFIKEFPALARWTSPERAWFRKVSANWLQKKPKRFVSWTSMLFFVGALYSVQHALISQTPTEMFPKGHPFKKGVDYVQSTRGWVADAHLVFERNVDEKNKLSILTEVQKDPLVVRTERFAQVDAFLSEKIEDPLTKALISREIKSADLDENFLAKSGEEQVFLYLETTATEKLNHLSSRVASLCPQKECWLTGEFVAYAEFSKHLLQTLFDSLVVSMVLVGLVIAYLCYTLSEMNNFLRLLVTSFWGPAVLLSCISIFNISINFITCIVASVIVGLTGDNAIQFLLAKEGGSLERGIENRGHGAIQCSIIMAACTLSFTISYFEPARTLGYLLSAGFIFALIGDLWILQGFLKNKPTEH